jgi:hypothetical protein
LKPTIPGIENSWRPSVYPLPAQAPAAPPGLAPSSVYSFGSGQFSGAPTVGKNQNHVARAPALPAAPGYLGPASAMAYQMAGPRVGFAGQPGAPTGPSAPPTSMVNPFLPGPGGGAIAGGGAPVPDPQLPVGLTQPGDGSVGVLQGVGNITLGMGVPGTSTIGGGIPGQPGGATLLGPQSPGTGSAQWHGLPDLPGLAGTLQDAIRGPGLGNYTQQGINGPMGPGTSGLWYSPDRPGEGVMGNDAKDGFDVSNIPGITDSKDTSSKFVEWVKRLTGRQQG